MKNPNSSHGTFLHVEIVEKAMPMRRLGLGIGQRSKRHLPAGKKPEKSKIHYKKK